MPKREQSLGHIKDKRFRLDFKNTFIYNPFIQSYKNHIILIPNIINKIIISSQNKKVINGQVGGYMGLPKKV